jgi:hypothetical protein
MAVKCEFAVLKNNFADMMMCNSVPGEPPGA